MRDALVHPLLDAALRGAVVLLAALVLTTLLHRRSAATRHAIWAGAIVAQLLLLGLAVWGPRWRVAAPKAVSAFVPPSTDATIPPARVDRATPTATERAPVADDAATQRPMRADSVSVPQADGAPSPAPAPAR